MESSRYQPPVKQSLSDEELSVRVSEATKSNAGLEAAMQLLVTQEALRAQEDRELAAWIMEMESEGSPEALAALAKVRGQSVPQPGSNVESEPQLQSAPQVEPVHETSVEVETPVAEPFSWFTKTDEVEIVVEQTEQSASVTSVEETITNRFETDLHLEGQESVDEFEQLLVRAAAEEELTALEDAKQGPVQFVGESNVQIPTDEHRNRKPISQFAAWLGLSAVVIPALLAFTLLELHIEFNAVILDLGIGYLIAGSLVSIASLAGKRSGLSTGTISRAIFGVWGNSVPLSFMLISRLLITALAAASFGLLFDGFDKRLPAFSSVLYSLGGLNITVGLAIELTLVVIAFAIALFRSSAGRIVQLILSLLAFGFFFEGVLGMSTQIGKGVGLSVTSGFFSKESLGAIALVILVVTTTFVGIAPNLAKSIPMKHKGIQVFGIVLASNFAIPFAVAALVAAWIGTRNYELSQHIMSVAGQQYVLSVADVRYLIEYNTPVWVRGSLGTGITLGIIFLVAMSLRTAAQEVISLFRLKSKSLALLIGLAATSAALVLFAQQPPRQMQTYLVNILVVAAVLCVGWIGMFITDVALRRIAYHELSLTRSYGFYGKFNWISIGIWLVTTALAVLTIPVDLMGFEFTGSLGIQFGLDNAIASQSLGFSFILVVAAVLTLAARIPQIRKQEREVLAVESRREQLNDIFVSQD
jgi:purine-cytosine permease-like protein